MSSIFSMNNNFNDNNFLKSNMEFINIIFLANIILYNYNYNFIGLVNNSSDNHEITYFKIFNH